MSNCKVVARLGGRVLVVVTHVNNGVHWGVEVEEHRSIDVVRKNVVRNARMRVPTKISGMKSLLYHWMGQRQEILS